MNGMPQHGRFHPGGGGHVQGEQQQVEGVSSSMIQTQSNASSNISMEREQRMLESSMDVIHGRIHEIKLIITQLLAKVETLMTTSNQQSQSLNYQKINWSSFLDTYALILSEINNLFRYILTRSDSMDSQIKNRNPAASSTFSSHFPDLKRYVTLPLTLSQDHDQEIYRQTGCRFSSFSHDMVPDYLRTKPDPEVEAKYHVFETKSCNVGVEAAKKQLNVLEKITQECLKHINRERDEIEAYNQRFDSDPKSFLFEETLDLVAAVNFGAKGLKPNPTAQPLGPDPVKPPQHGGPLDSDLSPPDSKVNTQLSNHTATVKTNVRGANQIYS